MLKKTIISLLLFQYLTAFSQSTATLNKFELTGKITDSIDNKAIDYANVVLLFSKDSSFVKTCLTNTLGYYQLKEIPADTYIVRINVIGYIPAYKKMVLNKNTELNFNMIKAYENLETVTVSALKPVFKLEAGKRIYLTSNDASIQNAFAVEALENAPGVFINYDGTALIRGQESEIWINGRPTKKNKEQLQEYLRNLPATNIEKIEIITNPSARYSAVNTNSIVNIVLYKKMPDDKLYALGLRSNLAQNCYQNQTFATAYISKKNFDINAFIRYGLTRTPSSEKDLSYELINTDTIFIAERSFNNINEAKNYTTISTEMTYRFNDNTSISGNVYYHYNELVENNSTHQIRKIDLPVDLLTESNSNSKINDLYGQLIFEHNFQKEGHSLNFDISYGNYFMTTNYFEISNLNINEKKSQRFSLPLERELMITFNTLYSLPLNENLNFQFGIESSPYTLTEYKFRIDTVSSEINLLAENETLSQEYSLNTPSYDAFTILNGTFQKINFEIGFRYEYNSYHLAQTTPKAILDKIYKNIYPSASIAFESEKGHSFSLSYSRRAVQPFENLNPYIDRTSEDYIYSGNPALKEALTNSFDLTYFIEFENTNITASLYRRNTKNDIFEISEKVYDTYFNREVILQTYENCADNVMSGNEISISSSLMKGLKLNISSDFYYKQLTGSFKNVNLKTSSYEISSKMKLSYKFFKIFNISVNPVYNSDNIGLLGNSKGEYYINTELSFDLWNKRFSFLFRQKDIFATRRQVHEYQYNNLYHYSSQFRPYQMTQFSVVYRFGNPKFDRNAKINELTR